MEGFFSVFTYTGNGKAGTTSNFFLFVFHKYLSKGYFCNRGTESRKHTLDHSACVVGDGKRFYVRDLNFHQDAPAPHKLQVNFKLITRGKYIVSLTINSIIIFT